MKVPDDPEPKTALPASITPTDRSAPAVPQSSDPPLYKLSDDELWLRLKEVVLDRDAAKETLEMDEQYYGEIPQEMKREELAPLIDRETEIVQVLGRRGISQRTISEYCATVLADKEEADLRKALRIARGEAGEGQLAEPPAKTPRPTANGPNGFDGLGQKKRDYSQALGQANLTERQQQCFSMKFEYELSLADIARRLGIHRSTVDESLRAAKNRLERDGNFRRELKRRIAHQGSQDD